MKLVDRDYVNKMISNPSYSKTVNYGETYNGEQFTTSLIDKDEFRKALYEAPTVEIPKGWTYCNDELPEPGEEYLITYAFDGSKKTFLSTSEFDVDYTWILDDDIKHLKNVRVIAWMPLPEPVKERN